MKIENILLVRTTESKDTIPPLGLLYIASALRDHNKGYKIKIFDFMVEGCDYGGFVKALREFRPNVIGFSSLSFEFDLLKNLSTLTRNNAPKGIVILGGPLATNYHSEIIKNGFADFAVLGEGELAINELLDVIQADGNLSLVKGVSYLKDGKEVLTSPRGFVQDLDQLPFPAWDLIELKNYANFAQWNGRNAMKCYAPIVTSRGCAYHCIYCHSFFGKNVRIRSVQNVLSEMEHLCKKYGVREFHIIDDFFNFDLARVNDICKGIIERKLNVRIAFPNGIRADKMDSETLQWLKKAGTYKINYAIETASPRLQKFIKKNLDLKKAKEVIDETSKLGIITLGFFMLGFPTETLEEMNETVSFAVNSRLDTAKFFKVTAFCNTELAQLTPRFIYGDDMKYVTDEICDDRNLINYTELSTETLNDVIRESYWKFYGKLRRILRILIKYHNLDVIRRLFFVYRYSVGRREETNKRTSPAL